MRILVIQNNSETPIGLVGETILKRGGVLETAMPEFGGSMPVSPDGYAGLIILGGEMSANDDTRCTHFVPLLELIRQFGAADRPVMGLCLGAQLIARAFGASVFRHTHVEFGYLPLDLTEQGKCDPILGNLANDPVCLQFHEDTFDMPEASVKLVTGRGCENQAFRLGNKTYGFQFHLEATDELARTWARLPEARAALDGSSPIDCIERDLKQHYASSRVVAETITDGWLRLVRG